MIYKNATITTFVRFFCIAAGFITSVLTARYLGPAGRGDYFFVTTLTLLLAQFAQLGLASSNTYLVAKQSDLLGKLLINSTWVSLSLGFTVSGLALAMLHWLHIPLVIGSSVLFLLVPASIFYLLGGNLLVGINKIAAFNGFQLGSNGLLLFCCLAVIGLAYNSVCAFLVANLLGWLVVAIVLFIYLARFAKINRQNLWFNKDCLLQGATYGIKAYVATLFGLLVPKGNILLLRYFCSDDLLGYYSIASQLNDTLAVLPASIGLVLFPGLVRNESTRWEEMKKTLGITLVLLLGVCLLAVFLTKPFIQIAFGDAFLPAVDVFLLMLPGVFFLSGVTIVSQYLAAEGFPGGLVVVWLISLVFMVGSSLVLIPHYAVKGAALSLSGTYMVLSGMIWLLAKRQKRSSR